MSCIIVYKKTRDTRVYFAYLLTFHPIPFMGEILFRMCVINTVYNKRKIYTTPLAPPDPVSSLSVKSCFRVYPLIFGFRRRTQRNYFVYIHALLDSLK